MSTIELELSEEERAELLATLTLGLSDTTVSKQESSKSISLKKEKDTFKGPPVPAHRDGMGRYIPKVGENPLSQCDVATPGPGDYNPDYTVVHNKLPEYSMREAVSTWKKPRKSPAPNKYHVEGNMVWGRCKRVTIRKKLEEKIVAFGPGPATHSHPRSSLGGPRFSIRAKSKDERMPGLVSTLAKVPDPNTPGPWFRPCNDEWLQRPQTFGHRVGTNKKNKKWPSPASYFPRVPSSAPKWHISGTRGTVPPKDGPGPAAYDKKPLVPARRDVSMGIKFPQPKCKHITPAPNQYTRDRFKLDEPGFTLQYRWYETETDPIPGPGHYRWKKDPTAKGAPAYSFPKNRPGRDSKLTPGPGEYNVSAPPMNKGITICPRLVAGVNSNPGPGMYHPEKSAVGTLRRAPAFSLAGRCERREDDENAPGPGTYIVNDRAVLIQKPGRSIGLKLRRDCQSHGPGPAGTPSTPVPSAGDTCKRCDCDKGVTVKSRHTPNKYLGLAPPIRLNRPEPGIPEAPLIG